MNKPPCEFTGPEGFFSRALSAQLEDPRAHWAEISQDLLRAKIQADADVSTRLE